jgi:hypothetical protein
MNTSGRERAIGILSAVVLTGVCVYAECQKTVNFGNNIWGTVQGMPCWIDCEYDIIVCMSGGSAQSCTEQSLANFCKRGTTSPGAGGITTCDEPYTWEYKSTTTASTSGECNSNPPGGGED